MTVADEFRASLWCERIVHAVRERTLDDWWERAAAIMTAERQSGCGWSDPLFDMLSSEVPIGAIDVDWAEVDADCYEGWREAGLASLAHQLRPYLPALRVIRTAVPSA